MTEDLGTGVVITEIILHRSGETRALLLTQSSEVAGPDLGAVRARGSVAESMLRHGYDQVPADSSQNIARIPREIRKKGKAAVGSFIDSQISVFFPVSLPRKQL